MIKIEVVVKKIFTKDPKSNFCIMSVAGNSQSDKKIIFDGVKKDNLIVKGNIFSPKEGDVLICEGEWQEHPKYGMQLSGKNIYPAKLIKHSHAKSFLNSKYFYNLGRVNAGLLYQKFGDDVFDALSDRQNEIRELIGVESYMDFVKEWLRARPSKEAFYFLRSLDVMSETAMKIVEQADNNVINIISNNPYILMGMRGVGFKTADDIALRMGLDEQSASRVYQGIKYTLDCISNGGNTSMQLSDFKSKILKMTEMEVDLVYPVIDQYVNNGMISVIDDGYGQSIVVAQEFYRLEMECAEEIKRLVRTPLPVVPQKIRFADQELVEEQKNGVVSSVSNKISIMTGGPGVGKTKTTKAVIFSLEDSCSSSYRKNKVVLCAPTGKAARRMSKSTGRDSCTIHSLLEFTQENGFLRNENNKLDLDSLIIDEFSMVDIRLFCALLRALPSDARLIMIGDADQLPSVDPGNVLQDMISSGMISTSRLIKTFRQKEGSHIISNAHLVNSGKMPIIPKDSEDFHWIDANNDDDIASIVTRLMSEVIPKRFGINIDEIQVLTPQKGTIAGVDNLNTVLKEKVNPARRDKISFQMHGNTFTVNDRVMQIKNNKTLGISNGEVGKIKFIDYSTKKARVLFDDSEKIIPFSSFRDMRLGYASTVHKSQGSEYEAVIIPISKNHEMMLTPDIVYTGMTRGKKQVFFVGDRTALENGLKNKHRKQRKTSLSNCLKSALGLEVAPVSHKAVEQDMLEMKGDGNRQPQMSRVEPAEVIPPF